MGKVMRHMIEGAICYHTGMKVKIGIGKDYYWFYSDDETESNVLSKLPSSSVMVSKLSDLTVEQWVDEFKRIVEHDDR